MFLIHVRLRAVSAPPDGPPLAASARHGPALAEAGIEHVTGDPGWRSGAATLTLFVRAPTLELAENRVHSACRALVSAPWAVRTLWPGIVSEYYERRLGPSHRPRRRHP
ncbi:hypothetical protein ACGFNX_07280 [Streptomyces sp. NPDC048723]|uniref:hypothetical protein n=1 Tax=unclassified Streptomyces TaxID=2593676 RepID=UPI000A6E536F